MKYPQLYKMPYYRTRVDPDETIKQIKKLLKSYDITDQQWTEIGGKEQLKFIFTVTVQGVEKRVGIQMDIPEIKATKGVHQQVVPVPKPQRYRMFYWALKSLLEATRYGILHKEDVFFSYTLTQLPSGEILPIKKVIDEHGAAFLLSEGK